MQYSNSRSVYAAIGAVIGWASLALQLYLSIDLGLRTPLNAFIQFISFFTITTNIVVAISFTAEAIAGRARNGFFNRNGVLTAVAVYITIVGIVYNLFLRQVWDPQGWQKVVDISLHSFIPVFFVLYWFMYVNKSSLQYRHAFNWLVYPVVYIIYSAVRGAYTGLYMYPFVDVGVLGYPAVIRNSLILFATFFLLSLSFIFIGRAISKKTNS